MTNGVGNWFRAGALAIGLSSLSAAGCSSESFPDGNIPPLAQPDPNDTTIPDTPQANLDACLPADTAGARFRVLVEADNAHVGSFSPLALGQFRMVMPSGSLTILSGGGGSVEFRGRLKWDSTPAEFADLDPSQASGPIALLTQARLDGQPLTNSSMTAPGVTGAWASQFPGFTDANRVGFSWPVEGSLTYNRSSTGQVTDCVVDMTVRTNARTTSSFGPSLDYFVLSLYPPRSDGRPFMAASNFAGETPVILQGAVDLVLPTTGEWQDVCTSVEDCGGSNGTSASAVRARILRNAPMAAHSDGGVGGSDGSTGGHDAGGVDSGHDAGTDGSGGSGGDAGVHDSGSGGG